MEMKNEKLLQTEVESRFAGRVGDRHSGEGNGRFCRDIGR